PAHVAGTGHRAPGLVRGRRRRPRPRLRHARRGGVRRTAGGPTPLTRPEQAGVGARPETDWGGRGPGTYTRTAPPGPVRADRQNIHEGAPAGGEHASTPGSVRITPPYPRRGRRARPPGSLHARARGPAGRCGTDRAGRGVRRLRRVGAG